MWQVLKLGFGRPQSDNQARAFTQYEGTFSFRGTPSTVESNPVSRMVMPNQHAHQLHLEIQNVLIPGAITVDCTGQIVRNPYSACYIKFILALKKLQQ